MLRAARAVGGFEAARRLAGKGVRILCYHGFSLDDEHRFRPELFITPRTFEQRLKWLLGAGYQPVSLDAALERLQTSTLTGRELVVTIDDGFFSVKAVGWPVLQAHGFSATLYVTTYYTQYPNPIFRLALQYMAWRTSRERLDLSGMDLPIEEEERTIRLRPVMAEERLWRVIRAIESGVSEARRVEVAACIGEQLGVDYHELARSRRLSLLSPDEISELAGSGLDIQLHTHRHRMPLDTEGIRREIADNRRVLAPLTSRPLTHFCYPSGIWNESLWPGLVRADITSATTCEPGINHSGIPLLRLRRFLDSEELPWLEFEAELSGFKDVARGVLSRDKPKRSNFGEYY
jgi:peptidoglycan/xylan/chitin deacetylase (PgdA/CDA1 family)